MRYVLNVETPDGWKQLPAFEAASGIDSLNEAIRRLPQEYRSSRIVLRPETVSLYGIGETSAQKITDLPK